MNVVYVTGNEHKAKYFKKMVGLTIPYQAIELDEIQSLSLEEIVTHKVKQAYAVLKKPVIVEDTKLTFLALGDLPGPFIKWFQESLGNDGLCRLLDGYEDRTAVAGAAIAYYDGQNLQISERELLGKIVKTPTSSAVGFGWNAIFMPAGETKTLGEMDEEEFMRIYAKVKPFDEIKSHINNL